MKSTARNMDEKAEEPVFEAEDPVFEAEVPVFEAEDLAFESEDPVFEAEDPVFEVEPFPGGKVPIDKMSHIDKWPPDPSDKAGVMPVNIVVGYQSASPGRNWMRTRLHWPHQGPESTVPIKRPRTSEDFLLFCKFILEHENYEAVRREEKLRNRSRSPRNSAENRTEGTKSERVRTATRSRTAVPGRSQKKAAAANQKVESPQRGESSSSSTESDTEGEGFNEVTCYCGKPYAGRPMIECSKCLTWLHLSCARVKRTNIPDEYICTRCREPDSEPSEGSSRGSSSSRSTRNKPGDL